MSKYISEKEKQAEGCGVVLSRMIGEVLRRRSPLALIKYKKQHGGAGRKVLSPPPSSLPVLVAGTAQMKVLSPSPSPSRWPVLVAARTAEMKVPSSSWALIGNSSSSSSYRTRWVVDSGATDHMTGSRNSLYDYRRIKAGTSSVSLANGSKSEVAGVGRTDLTPLLHLSEVLHLPDFPENLLSVHQITSAVEGCVVFYSNRCYILDDKKKIIGKGRYSGSQYELDESFGGEASTDLPIALRKGKRRCSCSVGGAFTSKLGKEGGSVNVNVGIATVNLCPEKSAGNNDGKGKFGDNDCGETKGGGGGGFGKGGDGGGWNIAAADIYIQPLN